MTGRHQSRPGSGASSATEVSARAQQAPICLSGTGPLRARGVTTLSSAIASSSRPAVLAAGGRARSVPH